MPVKPLLAAFLLGPLLCGAVRAGDVCSQLAPDSPVVRLAGLNDAGDPVLADGRPVRLVGLAPRQDEAEAARFARAIGGWRGRDLALVVLGEADRWGRLPVRLYETADSGSPRNLADALLREGAGVPLPEARPARCDGGMVAASAAPRRRPAPAAAPLPAGAAGAAGEAIDSHDLAALKAQEGRLVFVTGRVASVGERAQRTYLNFSRRRGEAASIVLSKAVWRQLQDAGWTASGLGGKRLRAQGILSGRDGLLLDVTAVAALELID